jgi:hypothetical protein
MRATVEHDPVFNRSVDLEAVPDGYRALAARQALKIVIRP